MGVGLADIHVQRAGAARGIDQSQRALLLGTFDTLDRGRHASGRFVVRPAVSVHIFGELRQAIRARFAREDLRILKERRGLRGLGEFRAEGAVRAERRLAGDKRRAGDVPERAGAAVAQHDLIAVGNLEEIRQAFADGADHLLDRGLAVRGAQKIARARIERLDLLRTDFARPRAETSILRKHVGRNVHSVRHVIQG